MEPKLSQRDPRLTLSLIGFGALRAQVGATAAAGAAYVFYNDPLDPADEWTEQAILTAPVPESMANVGFSVGLSGDLAIAGAWQEDTAAGADAGAVYVYGRSGTTWTYQATLTPSDGAAGDRFGTSVALSEGTALVGAHYEETSSVKGGAAYFFPPSMLPVELTSFAATADGGAVVLSWTTASETNNAGFEVEHRSGDAAGTAMSSVWQRLAFVEGRGTAVEAQTYGFRAEGLAPGTHRFRLKQVDYDGVFEYSPEVEVVVEVPRRLALEAPGTWAHSLAMANLCESACNIIGANGLLARVGCYYHDIGKVLTPQYYVENQARGRRVVGRADQCIERLQRFLRHFLIACDVGNLLVISQGLEIIGVIDFLMPRVQFDKPVEREDGFIIAIILE